MAFSTCAVDPVLLEPNGSSGNSNYELGFPTSGHAHIIRIQLPRYNVSAQEISGNTNTAESAKTKLDI